MDRFDRIFELNRILQAARYPVSRQQLERELECSRATVKRLIEEMRLYLNAPIVYDRKLNGYRYDPREGEMYELPGLWFNASELHALLAVQQLLERVQPGLLESHLQPLRRKIDDLLARQQGDTGESLSNRIRLIRATARPTSPFFTLLAGCLAARRRLHLVYYNRARDMLSEREVSPQRLTHYRDNWYLDAWCHLREGLRTFALDAIRQAWQLDQVAQNVEEAVLERHFTDAYGIFSGQAKELAVVRFSANAARWVATEEWHPRQQSRWLGDGRYELTLPYSDPSELLMDLLKYGPDVEVVSPPELRSQVQQRLRSALDIYNP
ncbi:helix-turn-helix transcriptional regulator [Candidatus Thiodiazotropha sp. CDECU1]|uniref:helix-turn-helix transcriptional regulator n=1 Tax=Candidatus Thiodiazotropha sp. CDECU1 TaxID=3065865 RepID=UPI00292EC2BD|nr:WYL domain-containing protein [Candidatus Thiodiazotropha sp. CDECU1]